MQKLSLVIWSVLLTVGLYSQSSPHGTDLEFECKLCHTTSGWTELLDPLLFNHSSTSFLLTGQHQMIDCKACHSSMVFSEAGSSCVDCHTDMHNNTLGANCAECHDTKSWIIENVNNLHLSTRFPLIGAHRLADCIDCHPSSTQLIFEPLGILCFDCHKEEYLATTQPNHVEVKYSTICSDCHTIRAFEWGASGFAHNFFPLIEGHAIAECADCHTDGNYEGLSADCIDCHQTDFNATVNPNHILADLSQNCSECHSLMSGWKPADFRYHDQIYFPIYSGKHSGEWDKCTDCHSLPENYTIFSCTDCHEHNKSKMDDKHEGVNGYAFASESCVSCHPNGNEDGFDHNRTNFPLTGSHINGDCLDCHSSGYQGTPTLCFSCHKSKYDEAQEPIHVAAGISDLCEDCHNTTDWTPSSFDHVLASNFYLRGGHEDKQCSDCHLGNTESASSACISCHQVQYDEALDHAALEFPLECEECHTVYNWEEASFDHNLTDFPLTGAHVEELCIDCHENGYQETSMLCMSCHQIKYDEAQEPNHTAAGISDVCEDCHNTIDWTPSTFDHVLASDFYLQGGHADKQCSDCHTGNTESASSACISCHQVQYNNAPDHVSLEFPLDCEQCHTIDSWEGATFDHNNTDFPLTGAHVNALCISCHENGYQGTSSLCISCHQVKYDEAQEPNHTAAGISNLCQNCHNTSVWVPSIFDHALTSGFYLLGGHADKQCSDCHTGNTESASSACISCHQVQYNNAPDHVSLEFPLDCEQCHTIDSWEGATFDHNNTDFPLTGAHVGALCISCHENGYTNTSSQCYDCHQANYDQSSNPNHLSLSLSLSCAQCHSTNPGWEPATFTIHNSFYVLSGC